jgi:glutamate-ammonia-ligase adenylyltransferase
VSARYNATMTGWNFSTASLPKPFDAARAARTFERLAEQGYSPQDQARTLLEAAFGNSAYLCRLALKEHEALESLFADGPGALLAAASRAALAAEGASKEHEIMAALRGAKRQTALAVALADIVGTWNLEEVTGALTAFADAALKSALRFALKGAARGTALADKNGEELEAETGLIVLAMGKYGAYELNYSSDIDLVVFYDAEVFPFRKLFQPRAAAVDLVKTIVKLIGETTSDGYVFRVDLRLRPDAGATQIAISSEAAVEYYEDMGQNWERAALIKARPAAGDGKAAARFLSVIEPFVWRRSLDFAAIEDIHSIKRQIHAHKGHSRIAAAGHNIKLGRGGIREIEFFVQTQQLILGGRDMGLRERTTLVALQALAARGHVTDLAARELAHAYRFLRTLEHRLQMMEDEQTHSVPKSREGIEHIACFMGFDDERTFSAALLRELETVQGHCARLFERSAPLAGDSGSLVFTGVEDDPETLETLRRMGFHDPGHVSGAIRGWHHGRIRATRSARARELLTKLMPALLAALAATADPDAAFAQFDRFLSNLPAGVQLFSLLLAHSEMLRLIAEIMGSAPRLASHLSRSPSMLDALLDRDFLGRLPSRADLDARFKAQLAHARAFEAALDAARRFAKEQSFRVGVQLIEGLIAADLAGPAFADLAECVIAGLLPRVEEKLMQSAGVVKGGAFAVIAMGKLGGHEMTAGSDLDLVFVYEAPDEQSDGKRPLPVSTYYARLAQRLIAALTSATAEGTLYEVDMRLRPSGNKGPVAVSLQSFAQYQAHDAWTWERLALTRARVIAGPKAFCARLEAAIRTALCRHEDWQKIKTDTHEMRAKIAAEYPGNNPWDLKYAPGGLIDIEFVAQALQLRAAAETPSLLSTNTVTALKRLAAARVLGESDADALIAAAALEHALTQALRIALDGPLDAETATAGLKTLLARAGGVGAFENLQTLLADLQFRAHEVHRDILR